MSTECDEYAVHGYMASLPLVLGLGSLGQMTPTADLLCFCARTRGWLERGTNRQRVVAQATRLLACAFKTCEIESLGHRARLTNENSSKPVCLSHQCDGLGQLHMEFGRRTVNLCWLRL